MNYNRKGRAESFGISDTALPFALLRLFILYDKVVHVPFA